MQSVSPARSPASRCIATLPSQYTRCICAISAVAMLVLSLSAEAACDPQNARHTPCPAPTGAHSSSTTPSYHGPGGTGYTQAAHRPTTYTATRKPGTGPTGPGPLHATANATDGASKQGIIFVGGKPSNSKSALNPQPIPPGHGSQPAPKWDVSKNKRS